MVGRGLLTGAYERHGKREWLRIDASSVDSYLRDHGPVKRGSTRSRLEAIEEKVAAIAMQAAGARLAGSDLSRERALEDERDKLRATAVTLQNALARMRAASELQREADRERASVVQHLQAALGASERADELRLRAISELEGAVSNATLPGHAGELR